MKVKHVSYLMSILVTFSILVFRVIEYADKGTSLLLLLLNVGIFTSCCLAYYLALRPRKK